MLVVLLNFLTIIHVKQSPGSSSSSSSSSEEEEGEEIVQLEPDRGRNRPCRTIPKCINSDYELG
jgi:hypothetical protein